MTTSPTSPISGAVIYRGPSILDGSPIVVIVTGLGKGSGNSKTGEMAQSWILRSDIAPMDALRSGADSAVCGLCIHRPTLAAETGAPRCYVKVWQAPRSVWEAFGRGIYPELSPAVVGEIARSVGRWVRIGSYGDPGAVPMHVWTELQSGQSRHTAYTHQWQVRPDLRPVAMASVDSRDDAVTAQAAGWRTFRVLAKGEQLLPGEIRCPASKESGHRTTCARCGLCDGSRGASDCRASIAIIAH